jgi:hypothetical protein
MRSLDGLKVIITFHRYSALIALGALACHSEPVAPRSGKGLTLSLAVAHQEIDRGAPDSLVMTLTNTNPYSVSLSTGTCEPSPFVKDARGVTVVPPSGGWICIAVLLRLVLAPGEQFRRTFVWDTSPFAVGSYSVYATFSAADVNLTTPPAAVQLK